MGDSYFLVGLLNKPEDNYKEAQQKIEVKEVVLRIPSMRIEKSSYALKHCVSDI